jgi:NAD(P)-dependent dehydrogenase (short-subunit alcohol dehydrogenase family)
MDFADINGRKNYSPTQAYSQSKLANLLFAYELQRKLESGGYTTISVAAHPGYSATNLQAAGPAMKGSRLQGWLMQLANRLLAQDQAIGALPQLYAATAPDVRGGDYFGPNGRQEMRGYPHKVGSSDASHDLNAAAQLWQLSTEMSGISYPL